MTVFVFHRKSQRAYTYNDQWNIIEPLIYVEILPAWMSIRCFWRPLGSVPQWAMGIRDLEFDTYWLKGS